MLRGLHDIAPQVAEAIARKDIAEFGRLIDQVWQLNKRLDPDSSNAQIEEMLSRVRPWIHGAKLLGAGGGGFLLLICKSPQDAGRVRAELDGDPPNERARFFDFAVSMAGLECQCLLTTNNTNWTNEEGKCGRMAIPYSCNSCYSWLKKRTFPRRKS